MNKPPDTWQWLTVPEAAKELKLSERTTYHLVDTGQIPSVKFGKSIRIPRSALQEIAKEATK